MLIVAYSLVIVNKNYVKFSAFWFTRIASFSSSSGDVLGMEEIMR